jgi:hypothetical protein
MSSTIAKACCTAPMLLLALLLNAGVMAGQAPVFRVQQGEGPVSFLVGTMHSEDPRVTALMAQITPLIAQVEVVAVELVPDGVTMLAVGAASLLPVGQDLETLIGDARFRRLVAAATGRGIPREVLRRLKPWAAAVMLGMPASESGRVLDLQIYLQALETGRELVGLETAAEQLAVFEEMSAETQLMLLDEMVKNAEALPKYLEELTVVYLSGDLEQLDEQAWAQYRDMPTPIRDWFEHSLIASRNRRMAERAAELVEQRPVLLAVGAMHLIGETGLVEALRRRGFSVTPVSN